MFTRFFKQDVELLFGLFLSIVISFNLQQTHHKLISHQPDKTGVCNHDWPRCNITVRTIFSIMSKIVLSSRLLTNACILRCYVSHSLCVLFKYINFPPCQNKIVLSSRLLTNACILRCHVMCKGIRNINIFTII